MQKIRSDFRVFRRFGFLFVACVLCLMFWSTRLEPKIRLDYDEMIDENKETNDFCEGELLAYKHISIVNSTKVLQKGRPFDCSKLEHLKKFKLMQTDEIKHLIPSNYPKDLVFVSAANCDYFASIKAAFATVRRQFSPKIKFILYDLGDLKKLHGHKIAKMCNVELREFDFKQLPANVRNLHIFSWKVFILAEVFNEFTNIIYLDSSIFFEANDFEHIFQMMSRDFRLVPFQMSGFTGHSVQFATNQGMHKFLPFDLYVRKQTPMFEANLLLLHRSESTRQLLKWAVLCASTLDCIDPPGSVLYCDAGHKSEVGICNRQDQSVFNILVYNLESDFLRFGFPTIIHQSGNHPKNLKQRHQVIRNQQPALNDNFTCN